MKVRTQYAILCIILMLVNTVSAQKNIYLQEPDLISYNMKALSLSSIKYATFRAKESWFTITNDGIEGTNETMISASCTVGLASDGGVKSIAITPEIGVCYSMKNKTPTIEDDCKKLGDKLTNYTYTLSPVFSGTTYYFRVYIKLGDDVIYGDVEQAKTLGTAPKDNSKTINGHKFIDLGLPSGLLWAETNIGAETAADDGNYYAWGETKSKSLSSYTLSSYKYYSSGFTKYNSTDGKTVLEKEDDAAYVNWGTSCRMPTLTDMEELYNTSNCTWAWTSVTNSSGSSISGYKITSKNNGNSIFLPASGRHPHVKYFDHDIDGYYWSSTIAANAYYTIDYAYCLEFYEFTSEGGGITSYSHAYHKTTSDRYRGLKVRPVAK